MNVQVNVHGVHLIYILLTHYNAKAPGPGDMTKNSLVNPPSFAGNAAAYASFHCFANSTASTHNNQKWTNTKEYIG